MERVLGIGGYFLRAADPAALSAWYRDCLGLDADQHGLWRQETGPTVFATFESGTGYFGSRAQQTMLNFGVRDLDAMLAQLRAKGADVAEETQDMDGVGRFGWVTDPEGNRVELWQPACRPATSQRRSQARRSPAGGRPERSGYLQVQAGSPGVAVGDLADRAPRRDTPAAGRVAERHAA